MSPQASMTGDSTFTGPELETERKGFEHARERAADLLRRAKERGIEKEEEFEAYVKEHPVKSVLAAAGIGAGIGLVAGVILGRR